MRRIKTLLLKILGENLTAIIQALRFVWLIRRGIKFDPEMTLLNHFVKKGDVVIDVGANGADWTYALHKVVTNSGHIFAFEADPYYAKATVLAIKILRMKNVIFFPFGLSDKQEDRFLKVFDENDQRYAGSSHIDEVEDADFTRFKKIKLDRLDSLAHQYPEINKTSLIKCDVEGYELFVFKGARQVLERARPVIILEIGNFENHNYSANDVFKFFNRINYNIYAILENGKLTMTDENLHSENAISLNRVIIPKEKIKDFRENIE